MVKLFFIFIYHKKEEILFCRTANKLASGKELFRKKPLGRRWHLISSSARSGTANLVPLRLERSESAASPK